jgi:hypothetical protein
LEMFHQTGRLCISECGLPGRVRESCPKGHTAEEGRAVLPRLLATSAGPALAPHSHNLVQQGGQKSWKAGKCIHALKEWVREADCPPLTALHFRRSARLHRQALGLAHQPKYFLYFPKYPHLASSKEGVQTHVTRKSALKVAKVALSTGSVNQPKIEQPEHKSGDGGRWRPHCLPSLYPPCMHRDSLWPQLEGHSKVPFNRHAQSPFLAGYGQAPTT